MKRLQSNPYIYAFDIETSNTKNMSEQLPELWDAEKNRFKELSFMHQFTISRIDFTTGELEHVYAGHWIEELFDFFGALFEMDMETVVISHNFGGYESHLLKQYQWTVDHCTDLLAQSESKIITMTLKDEKQKGKVKILDSLLILQKSIDTLGKELGFPKLEYDYNEFKLPTDEFTFDEIEYCYRDNDISLLGLYNKCKLYPWIKEPCDIPVSATGFVRKELANNPEINKEFVSRNGKTYKTFDLWKYQCRNQFVTDVDQYFCMYDSFNGGYVHANPFYVGKVLHNLTALDFKSDYPGQCLSKFYPSGEFHKVDPKEEFPKLMESIKANYGQLNADWTSLVSKQKYNHHFYYGTFVFKNLRASFVGTRIFPNCSSSKSKGGHDYILVEDTPENPFVCDNGKVINAGKIALSLTDVELLNLYICYDWDDIYCFELYKCEQYGKMHVEIRNAINYFGIQKEQWKKVVKDLEQNQFGSHDYELPKEQLQAIEHSNDKLNLAKQYLQNAKASLNGIYGQQVQKPVQDNYELNEVGVVELVNEDLRTALKKERKKKQYSMNHSFCVGIYVTSYARLMLTLGFVMVCKSGCDFVYADTDSLKILTNGHDEELQRNVSRFNEAYMLHCKEENPFEFGTWDFEPTIKAGIFLGAKKYMVLENVEGKDTIEVTVAGLPKKSAAKYFTYLMKHDFGGSFDEMAKTVFTHNTLIDANACDNLGHSDYYAGEDVGNYFDFGTHEVRSMINLSPMPFDMNNTESINTPAFIYCAVLEHLFDNPQNMDRLRIFKDGEGYRWENI